MLKNMIDKELETNLLLIHNAIDKAQNIIITAHENPDGDSIGSSLAMYEYLKSRDKNPKIYFYNNTPECFSFMKNIDKLNIYNVSNEDEILCSDLIIILDVNSISRLKSIGEIIQKSKAVKCMLDHHYKPENIADFYAVNHNASATGEIVYQFLSLANNYELNFEIAEALYVAIMTDTGGFKFQNTNQIAHLIASDLLKFNLNPTMIFETIYEQKPQNVLMLLGKVYLSSELYSDNKFNIFTVTRRDLKKFKLSLEDLNGFSETTIQLQGVKVGALITGIPNSNDLKISLRSKENYDVRNIATQLGGGGHINAAGAKVTNKSIEEMKSWLIEKVSQILDK
jgi:bifunctional oligoribonuclease and PAP phosphatase NrnA